MTRAAAKQEEKRPDLRFSSEGGGTVVGCTGCTWETWHSDEGAARRTGADHKTCRAEDVAFLKRQRQLERRKKRRRR